MTCPVISAAAFRTVSSGEMLTGEMSPREGLLAAQWLGLKTVLPCHYITPEGNADLAEFQRLHAAAKKRGERVPESVVLRPGVWLDLTA